DQAFEVGLSFQNIPEMLLIPFDAVTHFADPSVGFELRFAVEKGPAGAGDTGSSPLQTAPSHVSEPLAPPMLEAGARKDAREAAEGAEAAQEGEPKVVSIDAFRKKS
ncbi:MAG: ClpXP protease specificity-enhancing factor SspB, partial [Methylocella sp.]